MADGSNQPKASPPADGPAIVASGPSRKVATVGIALVVVVVAIAVGLRLGGTSSADARSSVRGALEATLAHHTADLAISETIDVEGQIGTAKGTGKCDLRSDTCSATLVYDGALAQ